MVRKSIVANSHVGEGLSNRDRKNAEDWHEQMKI